MPNGSLEGQESTDSNTNQPLVTVESDWESSISSGELMEALADPSPAHSSESDWINYSKMKDLVDLIDLTQNEEDSYEQESYDRSLPIETIDLTMD